MKFDIRAGLAELVPEPVQSGLTERSTQDGRQLLREGFSLQ